MTSKVTDTIRVAALEYVNGPLAGTSIDMPFGELTVGRTPACGLVLNHAFVGKVHARITRTDAQILIEDLHSANGTFVNGQRITTEVIYDGDQISIGSVVRFRAHLRGDDGAAVVSRRPPATVPPASPAIDAAAPRRRLSAPATDREAPPASAPYPVPAAAAIDADDARSSAVTRCVAVRAIEVHGGEDGRVTLGPGVHTIGRSANIDVRLPIDDRKASRLHAMLTVSVDGVVSLENRGANGTFVNERRICGITGIRDGDRIRCGDSTLTVRLLS